MADDYLSTLLARLSDDGIWSGSLDDDGVTVTASGSAAASGEAASAEVSLSLEGDDHDPEIVAEGSATAKAEAEADEPGTAFVAASTDANITGADLIVTKDQTTTETDGDNPSVVSSTHVEAVEADAGAVSAEAAAVADAATGAASGDADELQDTQGEDVQAEGLEDLLILLLRDGGTWIELDCWWPVQDGGAWIELDWCW